MRLVCKRCGYEWESRIENPRQCPKCKSYEWNVTSIDKLDPLIAKYYFKEQTKLKERNFVSTFRNKIIEIMGDKCKCGKKGIVHHTTYENIAKYHNNLKRYCKFLKITCKKCHGKEPRTDYHKELNLTPQEYAKKIRDYEQMVYKKRYFKFKINLTLSTYLLKKLDKLKEYPAWKGNRSAVIEAAMEEFFSKDIAKEAKCIFCDCTDSQACFSGCHWVILDRVKGIGVCSNCVKKNGQK